MVYLVIETDVWIVCTLHLLICINIITAGIERKHFGFCSLQPAQTHPNILVLGQVVYLLVHFVSFYFFGFSVGMSISSRNVDQCAILIRLSDLICFS